ncbi:MAG: hypothetical protein QOF74_1465 [Caballeronia mineralivorans]|jgi:hypothetical protein|nr:hypothetical protein [Caballeronia mineralivorans]
MDTTAKPLVLAMADWLAWLVFSVRLADASRRLKENQCQENC